MRLIIYFICTFFNVNYSYSQNANYSVQDSAYIEMLTNGISEGEFENYKFRAALYFSNGDTIQAKRDLSNYLTLNNWGKGIDEFDSDAAMLYLEIVRGDSTEEVLKVTKRLEYVFEDLNDVISNIAYNYIQVGKFSASVSLYSKLLLTGTNENWLKNQAFCYSQMGLFDRQIANYQLMKSIDSTNSENYYLLGLAFFERGDYHLAENELVKSINLDACKFLENYNLLVRIYALEDDIVVKHEILKRRRTCL